MKIETIRGSRKFWGNSLAAWLLGVLLVFLVTGCRSTNGRSDKPWDSQLQFDDPTEDRLIK